VIIETIDDMAPELAFAALRRLPMPFIFSGARDGKRAHSYVGAAPIASIVTRAGRTVLYDAGSSGTRRIFTDPFEAVSTLPGEMGYPGAGPFPFNGGAAGYFSYDLKDVISPKPEAVVPEAKTRAGVPECVLGIYDPIFVYDHNNETASLVSPGNRTERVEEMRSALASPRGRELYPRPLQRPAPRFDSETTREQYIDSIKKVQEYISSGEIYQINISRRMTTVWESDPFSLYLRLLDACPAPFSSFMDMGAFQIICNTPERLMKVCADVVETGPIKGTRPRGADPDSDRRMVEELKQSVKERAEHVMIVDLERNDLGRVAVAGSVEVEGFEAIETYPHLHHMVSTVRARLRPGIGPASALKAAFPGGSITGAPKIRAMEIIDEIEPSRRGIYTGGIGWIDFNGDMDVSMAIRTALCRDGLLELNVGGGIVADSVPEDEYTETIIKAMDFLDVMGSGSGLPAAL